ncbi:MAG: hypothetical protein ACFWUL_11140 [Dialister sp.]|jgi:hypothetical protein
MKNRYKWKYCIFLTTVYNLIKSPFQGNSDKSEVMEKRMGNHTIPVDDVC